MSSGLPTAAAFNLSARSQVCAVFGFPIHHSASPAMQNAGIRALGLDWCYVACQVHPTELRRAIEGAKAMRFVGLNLTVPHKLLAVSMVDALDASAASWGAVNTIRFETQDAQGAWRPIGQSPASLEGPVRAVGFNTDAEALIQALREDLAWEPKGSRVLLLGAGGAGRAAALKLGSEGVGSLWLVNRTASKAEQLAAELHAKFPAVSVSLGYPTGRIDLVVNATSLGLQPNDPLPFESARFDLSLTQAVYDLIYRPAETPLLRLGRAAGARTANGLTMLLYQGTKALEIWSGRPAPVAIMRQALEQNVYGRS